MEVLYQKAIEYANLQPTDEVIDAYCGIGTISLSLAQYVHKAVSYTHLFTGKSRMLFNWKSFNG